MTSSTKTPWRKIGFAIVAYLIGGLTIFCISSLAAPQAIFAALISAFEPHLGSLKSAARIAARNGTSAQPIQMLVIYAITVSFALMSSLLVWLTRSTQTREWLINDMRDRQGELAREGRKISRTKLALSGLAGAMPGLLALGFLFSDTTQKMVSWQAKGMLSNSLSSALFILIGTAFLAFTVQGLIVTYLAIFEPSKIIFKEERNGGL